MTHWRNRDIEFLQDPTRWGRGYAGKPYTQAELEETRGYIADALLGRQGIEGYERRGMVHHATAYRKTDHGFVLPPSFDAEHPSRRTAPLSLIQPSRPTSLTDRWRVSPELERYYRTSGWELDQHGRAVSPLAQQVMEADIPVCTGYGIGYEGGETIIVDTVVTDGTAVLFNTRKDGVQIIPSLVGGYTHATDFTTESKWWAGDRSISLAGIFNAVRRTLALPAKAGIALPSEAEFEIAWGARPWSSVHTLNFWTLTYTVAVRLKRGTSRYLQPDQNAFWQPLKDIDAVVAAGLWPDHQCGLEAALR